MEGNVAILATKPIIRMFDVIITNPDDVLLLNIKNKKEVMKKPLCISLSRPRGRERKRKRSHSWVPFFHLL
jgi:hypothetical protein